MNFFIDSEIIRDKNIGASIKDLGKKWFAISRIDEFLPDVLARLDETWFFDQKRTFESEYIKFMELHGFVNVKLCDG